MVGADGAKFGRTEGVMVWEIPPAEVGPEFVFVFLFVLTFTP